MKPTEILLDLSELKLGRIIKKDFEEVIVDISAAMSGPSPGKFETFPSSPGPKAETYPTGPARKVDAAPAPVGVK